jgi:UDP-2-acetamido-2,6-beta-L-arabino-hexul-4-ose reductase
MLRIGITGQAGFIGSHLYNTLRLFPEKFSCIHFQREFFEDEQLLDGFVLECDVIVHLAAMNRHKDPQLIYNTNIGLVKKLITSLENTNVRPHILMSSSLQEEYDNLYGQSKKDGRELLAAWAARAKATFTGLLIPNVFGPFGKPMFNSVVATFSHLVANGGTPKIDVDRTIKLIYIDELISEIIEKIKIKRNEDLSIINKTSEAKVSEILNILNHFRELYQEKGEIPNFSNLLELNLFNTYRSYMDIEEYFPVKYSQHKDTRGTFVEVIRLGIGGQVSFSTTVPGITRGNHFHTRKIERFSVIKGKAHIQLRRVGTDKVIDFYLDGNEPSYVDMPVWYTHNIKNIGDELLYTNFWINEIYDSDNPDTYFESV